MVYKKIASFLALVFLLLSATADAQKTTDKISRSIPEKEGVSSKGIISFLDAVQENKIELHSFMFLRHGKVIAEGWWDPYKPDLKHTMYSTSKSFTATAVGFAVNEKLLTVNDKVISFFPGDLPDTISPYLNDLTVKDVLSMSVGQDPEPTFGIVTRDSNWVKSFLATPVVHKPGTKFLYNSLGTYILSAIVQKVTGQSVIEYLQPRLFKPLGIEGMDWETDSRGINTGGWGLRIKTEDMAKFGQLFLQQGKWKGKQILPKQWIEEATTSKIQQSPDAPQATKDSSDWLQGYCYQMWRSRNNAYRADGAFGQFIIVMPEQDAVIVITAEASDMQSEINLVWKYLLPAIRKNKLPVNHAIVSALHKKLSALALPLPVTSNVSPVEKDISGKTFAIAPNEKHINSISFQVQNDKYKVTLKTDTALYELVFASGRWQTDETTRRGPYLLTKAIANRNGLPPFKVAAGYTWKDDHTLDLTLRYIQSPHTEKIICRFDQDKISIDFQNSINNEKITLEGKLSK